MILKQAEGISIELTMMEEHPHGFCDHYAMLLENNTLVIGFTNSDVGPEEPDDLYHYILSQEQSNYILSQEQSNYIRSMEEFSISVEWCYIHEQTGERMEVDAFNELDENETDHSKVRPWELTPDLSF